MTESSKEGGSTAPRRRTQSERSAITRERVIRAVVDAQGTRFVLHATKASLRSGGVSVGDAVEFEFAADAVHLLAPEAG